MEESGCMSELSVCRVCIWKNHLKEHYFMDESKRLIFVTVVSSNYLHYAKALAKSISQVHPECRLAACVVDWDQVNAAETTVPIQWVLGKELITEGEFPRYAFKYDALELTCSIKPRIVQWAFDRGYQNVVYLDGDFQLYHPLTEITGSAIDYSVCLTPHLLSSLPQDGRVPAEHNFLSAGAYNAGFVAIKNNKEGLRFNHWWIDRLSSDCIIDIADNRFVDQRWLDLVPSLFDGVRILRQAGFHVAYWNLPNCEVTLDQAGKVLVDGHPLTLLHYSGFDPHDPSRISKYQNRIDLMDYPELSLLAKSFAAQLLQCDYDRHSQSVYRFSTMQDGTVIKPYWREAIRSNHEALAGIDNPFDSTAYPNIYQRFLRAMPDVVDSRVDWRLNPNAARKAQSQALTKLRKTWKKVSKYFRKAA